MLNHPAADMPAGVAEDEREAWAPRGDTWFPRPGDLPVHPAAAVFPLLPREELQALADDIDVNGLRHPIVCTMDGVLLDGRNRLAACELAGVEPRIVIHTGEPLAYVLGANITRRHLTTGQQAMATALALQAAGCRRNGRWVYGTLHRSVQSGQSAGFRSRLSDAGRIMDHAPDLANAVMSGTQTLDHAREEANRRRDARRASRRTAPTPPSAGPPGDATGPDLPPDGPTSREEGETTTPLPAPFGDPTRPQADVIQETDRTVIRADRSPSGSAALAERAVYHLHLAHVCWCLSQRDGGLEGDQSDPPLTSLEVARWLQSACDSLRQIHEMVQTLHGIADELDRAAS